MGLTPLGTLQAAFKFVPDKFVAPLPPSCNSNYLELTPQVLPDAADTYQQES
jgi:hypothetical protein